MLASLPDPRRLLWRGTVGSAGAHPAVRIPSGTVSQGTAALHRAGPRRLRSLPAEVHRPPARLGRGAQRRACPCRYSHQVTARRDRPGSARRPRRCHSNSIPRGRFCAHLGQMQMRSRASAGTATSASGEIFTVEHQHGSLPMAPPHLLGPPQMGHTSARIPEGAGWPSSAF